MHSHQEYPRFPLIFPNCPNRSFHLLTCIKTEFSRFRDLFQNVDVVDREPTSRQAPRFRGRNKLVPKLPRDLHSIRGFSQSALSHLHSCRFRVELAASWDGRNGKERGRHEAWSMMEYDSTPSVLRILHSPSLPSLFDVLPIDTIVSSNLWRHVRSRRICRFAGHSLSTSRSTSTSNYLRSRLILGPFRCATLHNSSALLVVTIASSIHIHETIILNPGRKYLMTAILNQYTFTQI